MLAIIDADTIVYKAAGACQGKDALGELHVEPVVNAYSNAKNLMLKILSDTGCNEYRAFLTASGDTNAYRFKLFPEYKANRLTRERPVHYYEVRDYLIKHWDAEVVSDIEADDAVCMVQYEMYKSKFPEYNSMEQTFDGLLNGDWPAILCGIDKDLDQIPGWHYNYNKQQFYYITPREGLLNFYLQLLTGDSADNIPRIKKGWRQASYETALKGCYSEGEMYALAYTITKEFKDNPHEYLQLIGNLIHLRRYHNDSYTLPGVERNAEQT